MKKHMMKEPLQKVQHSSQLCVIGGGMAGLCAAVAAARHGTKVVLMQDRPMLGGNASSEIRMWIRGAHGENMRETGILEEIALENIYRNPDMNFSVWDSVLWGIVKKEKNIELLLNCSCLDARTEGNRIVSVTGWQTTTQRFHTVTAQIFADCSGDSILAPLTGAAWRMGREGTDEFREDIAPEGSDDKTMGLSCLMQARDTGRPVSFTPPDWAYSYQEEDFRNKIDFSIPDQWQNDNFWWLELGGLTDTIGDTEALRDELIRTAYGVWDFIKNKSSLQSATWELDWMGFLPGKRESRRYEGDLILNQNDVTAGGKFPDVIAYGGWSMDDHNPAGFLSTEPPTTYHEAPSPYGIPYRCIYSKNIENLMFAGRNISATHAALSSTRVMATCGILGQALGTAAALAIREHLTPRQVGQRRIWQLQQALLDDDCYLPGIRREHSPLMLAAALSGPGDPVQLIDGYARTVEGEDHSYSLPLGEAVTLTLPGKAYVAWVDLILDSDLNRDTFPEGCHPHWKTYPMRCNIYQNAPRLTVPKTLVKKLELYADGELIGTLEGNYQRLVHLPVGRTVRSLRLLPLETWGAEQATICELNIR